MSDAGADDRFQRQLLLPVFGESGLPRLRNARVLVVGAGHAAAPALLYLSRSGVGTVYVDDGGDVDPWDVGAWLYGPEQVGQPRMLAAIQVLRAGGSTAEVRPGASDTSATAALVCTPSESVARMASERARLAGLTTVVALGDATGGEVLSIPLGAPCFTCAARPGARVQPRGAAATAIGTLAALELLLLLSGVSQGRETGRRLSLVDGRPRVEPTVRRPGCDCRNY